MLTHAIVLLVASLASGQAEARRPADDLAKLRGFLGTWKAKGVEIQGRKTDYPVSWKPILDGQFIELKWMFIDTADNTSEWGLVILGRDPADGKVRGWGFDNEGGFMAMELTGWEGNKSNWSTEFTMADGTKQKSVANSFALLDQNSYEWVLNLDNGDKAKAVFKRARQKKDLWPEQQVEAPAGIGGQLNEIAWWAANCTTEGSDAYTGKAFVGQSRCGWVLNANFLLYDVCTVDSDLAFARYRAVVGVDPTTKALTGWEFESTGAVGKYVVTGKGQDIAGKAISPKSGLLEYKGRMTRTADGFEYRATGSLPNDKKTSYYGIWKKRQ